MVPEAKETKAIEVIDKARRHEVFVQRIEMEKFEKAVEENS